MVIALAWLAVHSPARLDDVERAYRRSLSRIAQAKSLYVRIEDAVQKHVRDVWLLKPNRLRIEVDGVVVRLCDGKSRFGLKDGHWHRSPAGKGFDDDLDLFGFEPFLQKGGLPGDFLGPGRFIFKGKSFPSVNVKTTEAAVLYGVSAFDPKTLLPLGHTLHEYAELSSSQRYTKVRLNLRLSKATFAAPRT